MEDHFRLDFSGTCGNAVRPCQFTAFVPNGTAIYNYYMTSLGNTITRDLPRYRWVSKESYKFCKLSWAITCLCQWYKYIHI